MFGLNPYSIALKIAIALVVAGLAVFVTHRFDHAAYADLELKYAKANADALQASIAMTQAQISVAQNAGQKEAVAQQAIVELTFTTIQEVTKYVSDTSDCITYGLIRVFDAATLGVDPATLRLPAGQSNDTCAPVKSSTLASSVVRNLGAARANAEQLNALEDTIREMDKPRPTPAGK